MAPTSAPRRTSSDTSNCSGSACKWWRRSIRASARSPVAPSEAALGLAARDAWDWLRESGRPALLDRDLRLVARLGRRHRSRERGRRACGRARRRVLGRRRSCQRVVSVAAGPADGPQPLRVPRSDRPRRQPAAPAARNRRHDRARVAHGRALLAAARPPRRLVELTGGHIHPNRADAARYMAALRQFFAAAFPSAA